MQIRRGPAAVTGDEGPLMPLSDFSGGKARLEIDPEARRPAAVAKEPKTSWNESWPVLLNGRLSQGLIEPHASRSRAV